MTSIAKGVLQRKWQPYLMQVRNKTKINVTRPRLPHFERLNLETLCVPYFTVKKKPTHIPNYDLCEAKEKPFTVCPLEEIIAKEALNWFTNSKVIGIFHLNSVTQEENFNNKLLLKQNGFSLKIYGKKVLKIALKGTKFESILPLFVTHSAIAVCPEPNIYVFAELLNKLQKLVCIAAIVENRFLNIADVKYFGSYKTIDEARMQLMASLQGISQNLVQKITYNPSNLIQLLTQYQQEKNK